MRSHYAPDFMIKIEGLTMEADVSRAVLDLTYEDNVDLADTFTLRLNNADLRFTDSPLFDTGKNVEIHMGYANDLHPMMLGEITAVNPSFPQSGAPTLSITGYDKSHRMRHNQPARYTFNWLNDSAIAAQIAAENLLIPIVDPSPLPPQSCVLQTGSDWALLQELAERNGFDVNVKWDKLYFRFPRPTTEMVTLEWGKNLISFSPRMSTSGQYGMQVVRAYDPTLAQTIVEVLPLVGLGSNLDHIVERLGSRFVDQLVKLGRNVVRGKKINTHLDAALLAKTILRQLLEGLFEGTGRCIGMPELRAGELIEIRGIGKRFSGRYRLSKVTHAINESGYQTTFEVTQRLSTNLLGLLRKKLNDSPSPNKQDKINGTVTGIVRENGDPLKPGRVRVSFPHLSDENITCWAPVATPMAGNDSGIYFMPEVDDQVLVGFENGDINRPLVLGSAWNTRTRTVPQDGPTFDNHIRMIKTKAGHTIKFDDTMGGEQITIQDKAGSTITLTADGAVTIEAKGDLNLKAGKNVNIDATNVKVTVSNVMKVE